MARRARIALVTVGCLLLFPPVRSECADVPTAKRIEASRLVFIGTAGTVLKESAGEHRWHVAEVAIESVVVGFVPPGTVTVRTDSPEGWERTPNMTLVNAAGRRMLWTFDRNALPLEATLAEGPFIDLDDPKAVAGAAIELETRLTSKPKLARDELDRLNAVLLVLKRRQ